MDTLKKKGNKYLNLLLQRKKKEVLRKYTELWNGTKSQIRKIDNKPDEYGKDFMKTKFNSLDNLSLNKISNLHNLTIAFMYSKLA